MVLPMNTGNLRSNSLLLLTALIWGLSFVAQRIGMEHIGPMLFNGLRFALGAVSLLPMVYILHKRKQARPYCQDTPLFATAGTTMLAGLCAGVILFAGASLQQIGIIYTSVGNAGFITGLYVIVVPIIGIAWGQKTPRQSWLGAIIAVVGMYMLSVKSGLTINRGDLLVLLSALFFAIHVQYIARTTKTHDALLLSLVQYCVVTLLSLVAALLTEPLVFSAVISALPAILYGGIMSVGVAYTLQVVAQKEAHPTHAAIILSLEGAFAALGGWIILGEILNARELSGAFLMLGGMVASQLDFRRG